MADSDIAVPGGGGPDDTLSGALSGSPAAGGTRTPGGAGRARARAEAPPRQWWQSVLLASVAACAACGLIYELALLTLATALTGGGVVPTSLIVAGFVAALGCGALLAKPLVRWPAESFLAVEAALGIIGGSSALLLYVAFVNSGSATPVLVVGTAIIGMLVGAEVPLLMTLLQRGRTAITAAESGRIVANLNAADYLGALLGGVAWPFLVLPALGMMHGTLVTGMINVGAAVFIAAVLLRRFMRRAALWAALAGLGLVAVLLAVLYVRADQVEVTARQQLFADPVVLAERSDYQEIVVTRRSQDTRLFLDGGLQCFSADEYRYTEALVYPALNGPRERVLVLGGGDGLAARELVKFPDIAEIVHVELDPAVIELARGLLSEFNANSLADPRVSVIIADAFSWVRTATPEQFDAVIVDFPDPDNAALGRLYSQEFYGLLYRLVKPQGRITVQSGSPYSTPTAFWRTVSTIRSAGWSARPYHVHVPSFGDWGFTLARKGAEPGAGAGVDPGLPRPPQPLRFLSAQEFAAAQVFPLDRGPLELEPSTLVRPRIVDDMRKGYVR